MKGNLTAAVLTGLLLGLATASSCAASIGWYWIAGNTPMDEK